MLSKKKDKARINTKAKDKMVNYKIRTQWSLHKKKIC